MTAKNGEGAKKQSLSQLMNENHRQGLKSRAKEVLFIAVSTLRNVISLKEDELEAMRREVQTANGKAAKKEIDLQKSEHKRQKEIRGIFRADLDDTSENLEDGCHMPSPYRTWFHW